MKRFVAVILSLVFMFCCCACGISSTSNDEPTKEELQFVGTWISDNAVGDLYTFRLLPQGKVIWLDDSNGEGVLVTEEDEAYSGEWVLDETRIILFFNQTHGGLGDGAFILDITEGNHLEWWGHIFSKVE